MEISSPSYLEVRPTPSEGGDIAKNVQEGKGKVREVAQVIYQTFNAESVKNQAGETLKGLDVAPKVSGAVSGALELVAGFVKGRSEAALRKSESLTDDAASLTERAAGRVENRVARMVAEVDRKLETSAREALGWRDLTDKLRLPSFPKLENPNGLEAKAEKKSRKAAEMLRKGHTYAGWSEELKGLADRMSGKAEQMAPVPVTEASGLANEVISKANERIAELERQLADAKAKLEVSASNVGGQAVAENVRKMY